jgi:hypothetical protein
VDVEADGPVPGRYSLVSLGACVAAVLAAAGRVEIIDPDQHTFYRELKPISETWNEEALAVSGLTREHVAQHGAEPSVASTEFVAWVDEMVARFHAKPVFAAYPLGASSGNSPTTTCWCTRAAPRSVTPPSST